MNSHNIKKYLLIILIFTSTVFLGGNQLNNEFSFNINNNTTFPVGTELKFNLGLYGSGVKEFSFKLFKINDIPGFFTNSERRNLQWNFDILNTNKKFPLQYFSFIKEWKSSIHFKDRYYNYTSIDAGKIDEPGIYIIQAVCGDKVAYSGAVVSNNTLVYKRGSNEMLTFVADAKTGKFINNVSFDIYSNNKLIKSGRSSNDGIALINLENHSVENPMLIAKINETGEYLISDPYFYFSNGASQVNIYFYTDRPIYRPGQKVYFKGIVREKENNEWKPITNETFDINIKTNDYTDVANLVLTTNEFGSFSGEYLLEEEAKTGDYSVIISNFGTTYYGSFSVEEYKKPEYSVTVTLDEKQYSFKDTINIKVNADYYFGSPVTNAKVEVKIFQSQYWRPWWYRSPYGWFYESYGKSYFYYDNEILVDQLFGELNEKGELELKYIINKNLEYDFNYRIVAEVTDNARRTISGSGNTFVTRSDFQFAIQPDRYFYKIGTPVLLNINANDFSDNAVSADFTVDILRTDYSKEYRENILVETFKGSTDKFGKSSIIFSQTSAGYYQAIIKGKDKKGRETTSSTNFYVGESRYYFDGANLEIKTDKDAYEKGDTLNAFIKIPKGTSNILVSFDTDRIINYSVHKPDEETIFISKILTEEFSPSVNISVVLFNNYQFYSTSKLVGVLDKDKLLTVDINTNKNIFKPSEDAKYTITVKDNKGNPVPNTELSLALIDESIFAIKKDNTKSIASNYYSPQYSYMPVNSSFNNNGFNGRSRKIWLLDKLIKEQDEAEKDFGSVKGKLNIIDFSDSYEYVTMVFESDKNFYFIKLNEEGDFENEKIAEDNYSVYFIYNGQLFEDVRKVSIKKNQTTKIKFEINFVLTEEYFESDIAAGNTSDASRESQPSEYFKSSIETKSSDYVEPDLRTNFQDAAYWNAHIVTDKNGKAEINIKLPDNLTTWRATVRGATIDTKVGEDTSKIIARKDLLVRLETPRFFRENDNLKISTIVHNYLNSDKIVKISLKTDNIKLLKGELNQPGLSTILYNLKNDMYELTIKKNSEIRIDWNVEVTSSIGDAVITAKALTDEESDAVEIKVPILPYGMKVVDPVSFDYSDKEFETKNISIPQNVNIDAVQFSFSVSPSLAGTILNSLDDLVGYPYGCVEQTMSRFLPALIVQNTLNQLNTKIKSETLKKLPDVINKGLERLYSMQNPNGGWGWWRNDEINPYMTAYVFYGLSTAKSLGVEINESRYSRAGNNLINLIKNNSIPDNTTFAYSLFALSNWDEDLDYKGYINNLLVKELNSYTLSLLLIVASKHNLEKEKNELTNKLISKVSEEANYASWGENTYYWQNDKVQSTAFAVKALLQSGSNTKLIDKAVKWLLLQKKGYSWRSTQETATVLFALTDYLLLTNELDPDYSIKVLLNGNVVYEDKIGKENIFSENKTIKVNNINKKLLNKGNNELTVVKSGKGKVYFSGTVEYFTFDDYISENNNGFEVKREYYLLKQEQNKNEIKYSLNYFDKTIKSGDEIFVKVKVSSKKDGLQYFILEDMIPSGFEFVRNIDDYNIIGEETDNYYYGSWRWFYADREYRDEKIAFFVTYPNDEMEFTYIIKAQLPGEYSIMPSQASLMYYPEINGNSYSTNIVVKDN